MGTQLLLIGGRSGVGKTSVASALHAMLSAEQVRHALIEGDTLDLAWPPPWEHRLAERHLATLWSTYRGIGYQRLIYTNTVSVLEAKPLAAAMGDQPAVLLTATEATTQARLAVREHGEALATHLERSARAAQHLDAGADAKVHRIATDDRPVTEIAAQLRDLWLEPAPQGRP